MKKYLMSGIAAIAVCAAFTSCSKENLYDENSVVEKNEMAVREAYAQAFEKAFGKVGANVDWGFGPSRSNTRAGEIDPATHVGAYPDANMWTSKGFLAPDPLTPSQKLRAQYYFQMNQIENPNRPNNGQINFFMQQVYDGGTNPMPGKSPEVYDAADGNTKINSGEHMDHLTCGPDHTHTYNFNNGTCSTNGNVANRDQTDVNNTDGKQQHSDEIQLMLNTKTSCFGYANSDGSVVRDDRWTLVSAKTIDDFCDGDTNFKTWLNAELAKLPADANKNDVKCVDDFNRSYIGFDFDMIPDDYIYSGDYQWKDGKIIKVNSYNYLYLNLNNRDKVWNGTKFVDATSVGEVATLYGNKVLYPYKPGTTEKIHTLNDNANMYCGTPITIDDSQIEYMVNNDGKYLNLERVYELLADEYLPKQSGAGKQWIKVNNCADGYYSDWIVSFMPATPGENPNPVTEIEKLRVIAEDLSVGENTDFDFNDVVFDVIWTKTFSDATKTNLTSQKVEIKLLAAGGTLLLYVDGKEVHEQFGVDQYTMVNTDAKAHGLKGKDDAQPVTWETSNYTGSTIGDIANSIVVKVIKNGEEYLIRAERGHIASKIGVKFINDQEYEWCYERQDIEDKYSLMTGESPFQAWVQGIYPYDDWYTYAYDEIMKYRNKLNGAQGN